MIRPLELVEKEAILKAIVETDYNVPQAAKELRVPKSTVYYLIKKWKLNHPKRRGPSIRALKAELLKLEATT